MSQRANKSLAEQQEAFKKGLLNQSKVISSISEARSANLIKNHALRYKIDACFNVLILFPDHLFPTVTEGKIHINTEIYRLIQFLKVIPSFILQFNLKILYLLGKMLQ